MSKCLTHKSSYKHKEPNVTLENPSSRSARHDREQRYMQGQTTYYFYMPDLTPTRWRKSSNIIKCHFRRKNPQKKIRKIFSTQVQQARRSIVIRSLTGQRNWSKFTTRILRISSEILLFYKVLNATDTVVVLGNRDHREFNATAAVQFTISHFRQSFSWIFVFPLRSNKEILAKILRRYAARHDCLKSENEQRETKVSRKSIYLDRYPKTPFSSTWPQKKICLIKYTMIRDNQINPRRNLTRSDVPPISKHETRKTQPRERERERSIPNTNHGSRMPQKYKNGRKTNPPQKTKSPEPKMQERGTGWLGTTKKKM